jgi:hypothetical protein
LITIDPHHFLKNQEIKLSIGIEKGLYCYMSSTIILNVVDSQIAMQLMWLSSFFGNIDNPKMKPIAIYDDKQGCIQPRAHSLVLHT